jgi:hypothetical protein
MMKSAPKSVHYRNLKQACNYCAAPPTVVRATVTDDGSVYVATLCKTCAEGELETQCTGWDNPEGTSDFYRPTNGETPLP